MSKHVEEFISSLNEIERGAWCYNAQDRKNQAIHAMQRFLLDIGAGIAIKHWNAATSKEMPKFQVGQKWWCRNRAMVMTIIAVTDNQYRKIVVQTTNGDVFSLCEDGKLCPSDHSDLDLIALIKDN